MSRYPYRPRRPQTETLIQTYTSARQYQRAADQLAEDGWYVVSVTEQQPKGGCLQGCLLGPLVFIFRPKPLLVVTYEAPLLEE